jgi:hypothetical protein
MRYLVEVANAYGRTVYKVMGPSGETLARCDSRTMAWTIADALQATVKHDAADMRTATVRS